MVMVAAVGCTDGSDSDERPAFPAAPAACAGPDAGPGEAHRQEVWGFVRDSLAEAPESPSEMWLTFGEVREPEAVEHDIDQTNDVAAVGVFLAFEERQGTVSKIVDRTSGSLVEQADVALQRRLTRDRGAQLEPVDPAVAAGKPPLAGVLLRGAPDDLAGFVAANPCDVYGVAPGTGEPFAVISPSIEPPPSR